MCKRLVVFFCHLGLGGQEVGGGGLWVECQSPGNHELAPDQTIFLVLTFDCVVLGLLCVVGFVLSFISPRGALYSRLGLKDADLEKLESELDLAIAQSEIKMLHDEALEKINTYKRRWATVCSV